MSRIAVDIDSTLYDFQTPFREAFLKLAIEQDDKALLRGTYQVWDEYRSPADVCGPEVFAQALELVHSRECIMSRDPYEGAVETCEALAEAHEIRYISNRCFDSYAPTLQWLRDCEFPSGELVCTMDDKVKLVNDCQYIIDDRPKTLCEFVYHPEWQPKVRKGFGLLFPYNRALTDVPNIYLAPTWAGLNYYLVEKGVLEAPAYTALEA